MHPQRGQPDTAAAPQLRLSAGGASRSFTAAELLQRKDVEDIAIPEDVAYGRPMHFQAAPLRALLADWPADAGDTLEFQALDGFVAHLPRALLEGPAIPWLAIEDARRPWPNLPGEAHSAGPFYLVWEQPQRSKISAEQWPFAIVAIAAVAAPTTQWPELAATAGAGPAALRGQQVFLDNCFTCHRLAGAGEGVAGPDLVTGRTRPEPFSVERLRARVRNTMPAAPQQARRMPTFPADMLSDSDISALTAYLQDRDQALRTRR